MLQSVLPLAAERENRLQHNCPSTGLRGHTPASFRPRPSWWSDRKATSAAGQHVGSPPGGSAVTACWATRSGAAFRLRAADRPGRPNRVAPRSGTNASSFQGGGPGGRSAAAASFLGQAVTPALPLSGSEVGVPKADEGGDEVGHGGARPGGTGASFHAVAVRVLRIAARTRRSSPHGLTEARSWSVPQEP